MNLSVGIVGLPNAGKSTLFNALLGRSVANTAPYPFCTIDPNIGVVPVPDQRLSVLAKIVKTDKIVAAVVKFVDIAGLVKGASTGEGLGNQFLSHIRETDAICFVVRDFSDDQVVQTGKNPKDDFDTVKAELILKDLETIEKIQNEKLQIKTKNLIPKLINGFNNGMLASQIELDKEEREIVKLWTLLTDKPYFIVLNVNETDLVDIEEKIKQYKDWTVIPICAKLEEQLAGLSGDEQKEYLKSVGLEKSGLERLIKTAYDHLGLISFLTAGELEARAWTIYKGTMAPEAAGAIHTDFAKKFIKAKIVSYDDFVKFGGWIKAKDSGKVRLEGRDYIMSEADVVEFEIGN